ncbi:MAG TPA: tRNA pseudouridine(55) synthase TruB [Thermoanaerobaculia bacterium]|nr:tRNA pseudouridine(55) synthase TruB [Thermoanaerobaculia bacterium]
MDGLLLVDKQPGLTSHDVVDLVRRHGKEKKAGHTGTLDPAATGLLVLCLGRSTRLQAYLMKMDKIYEATVQFGWATATYDAVGERPDGAEPVSVEGVDFEPHLRKFRGEFEQMPPAFSAKKIAGVRAYELARKGEPVHLQPKGVRVEEFSLRSVDGSTASFVVRCSAGTYVRSLAHDLGASLGIPAHLKALRRMAIGKFRVEAAISSDVLAGAGPTGIYAPPHFIRLSEIDLPLKRVFIDPGQERKLLSGQSIILKPEVEIQPKELVSLMSLDDELVAIGETVNVIREGGGPVEIAPKVVLKR